MRKLVLLLALTSLSLAQKGWVNPYTGGVWNNPGSCLLDTMIRNRMNQRMLVTSIERRVQAPATAPRVSRLPFRRSDHLKNAEQLAASLTDSPAEREQLTGFFLEALGKYRVAANQSGRGDDLGHALAFCLACSYSVANGCDVPDDVLLALTRQMDAALADMPGLRAASDAQRQTLAETLVMSGMFVAAGYEQSNGREEARATYVALAQSVFHSLTGLEARNVTLSAGGMRNR